MTSAERSYYIKCRKIIWHLVEQWMLPECLVSPSTLNHVQRRFILCVSNRLRQLCCDRRLVAIDFLESLQSVACGDSLEALTNLFEQQDRLLAATISRERCSCCAATLGHYSQPRLTPQCKHFICGSCASDASTKELSCDCGERVKGHKDVWIKLPKTLGNDAQPYSSKVQALLKLVVHKFIAKAKEKM
jgi:hypothetical protein